MASQPVESLRGRRSDFIRSQGGHRAECGKALRHRAGRANRRGDAVGNFVYIRGNTRIGEGLHHRLLCGHRRRRDDWPPCLAAERMLYHARRRHRRRGVLRGRASSHERQKDEVIGARTWSSFRKPRGIRRGARVGGGSSSCRASPSARMPWWSRHRRTHDVPDFGHRGRQSRASRRNRAGRSAPVSLHECPDRHPDAALSHRDRDVYARLALELQRTGHHPVVYGRHPGTVADELSAAGILTTTRPANPARSAGYHSWQP